MVGVIDPGLVAAALGIDRSTVTQDLLQATRVGLLADREGRLIFRHALVRDVVSAGIVSVQKSDIHGRLARAIEEAFSRQLEPHSAALAHHWEEAGNAERAGEYQQMAGERALSFAATAEARAHFLAASHHPTLAPNALRGLAEVEFREGNDDKAAQLFRAHAAERSRADDLEGAARSFSRLAWAIRNKGASEDVFRTLDEALRLLETREDSPVFVELLVQKGQILSFHFGRFSEARPILERALDLARKHNDLALVAQASDGLAQVADAEGRAGDALEYGEAAMRAANESGVAEVIGRTFNNHAVKLASFGHPSEGLRILASGRDHLLRTYGSAGVSVMDVSAAWSSWLMGLPGEVALLTARGQAAWQRWRGYRSILEVWSALEGGQVPVAQTRLRSAWNALGSQETRDQFLEDPKKSEYETRQLAYAEGMLLLHMGDPRGAVDLARSVVAFDRESFGESFDVGQGLVLLAVGLVQSSDLVEAQQVVKEMEALLAPVSRYPYLYAHVLEVQGLVAASGQDFEGSLECFDQADKLLLESENQSDRARMQRLTAGVLLRADTKNGSQEAIKRLRIGLKITEACGAITEKNHIESELRGLGVRPRAGRPRRSDKNELTPREAEVAVLVAAGTTNARIAEQLFLSERTVQDHITNSLRKLGVSGRAGLAAWAARQGLV
jgi:DNA-binding CsgD family transcriptional regulator